MGERQPSTGERQADLTRVQMPREDQVEGACRHAVGDAREVTEEQAQRRVGIASGVRSCSAIAICLRVDPDEGDDHAANRDGLGLVPQEPCLLQVAELGCPRERVARHRDIVVPEHDIWALEAGEELPEARFSPRMRDEVARDADEVGLPRRDPVHGPRARRVSTRERRPEVEVREMRDPYPVESRRESLDRHLEDARAEPSGLEPAVAEDCERHDGQGDDGDQHHGTLERGCLADAASWERGSRDRHSGRLQGCAPPVGRGSSRRIRLLPNPAGERTTARASRARAPSTRRAA